MLFTTETITKEEIIEAKSKDIYSKGDADMLLMELAFEKVFNEKFKILTGNKELNNDIWNTDISELLFSEEHALHGGQYQYATYLLTGEKTNRLTNKEFLNASLKENLIYVTFLAGATLTDIEGNEAISLAIADGSHGCSIKAIEGDVVTIVNPWDSGKEIKVKTDDLIKCNNKIFFALNMSKEKTKWQEFWSNLKNSFVLFYNGLFSESNA